jgi:hypothetical protein
MFQNMQITAERYGWNVKRFENMYSNFVLLDYTVIGQKAVSDSCSHIKAKLKLSANGEEIEQTVTANVICEIMPYEPNPIGKWGVNPHSVLAFREEPAKNYNPPWPLGTIDG